MHSKLVGVSLALNVNVGVESLVRVGKSSMLVFGGVVSTSNEIDAGVASMFPATSTARANKWWFPSINATDVNGDTHEAKAASSIEHSNVALWSPEMKWNVGVLLFVLVSSSVMVVFGGVVSILNIHW